MGAVDLYDNNSQPTKINFINIQTIAYKAKKQMKLNSILKSTCKNALPRHAHQTLNVPSSLNFPLRRGQHCICR